jgi:hypothetical protein
MAIKLARFLLVVIIITALVYNPRPASSCAPTFEKAIFTYSLHPDFPLEQFAQGQLGILQPTYARSYLYVAYRPLIGGRFDKEEQRAILSLWRQRGMPRTGPPSLEQDINEEDWLKPWLEARKKILQVDPPIPVRNYRYAWRSSGYYLSHLNCPQDAFRTAVNTLEQRIKQFGVSSPEVKDWVQAQDRVFTNCEGLFVYNPAARESRVTPSIPDPAKPDAHPLVRADRTYQIAAAHFYAEEFEVLRS